ncbi:UDP-N-acetylglucosamine-N-acetylmuramylpentapeptide N-acetylglucosamine transferase [Motilibacter rhizosphaerae]|uniref:UDP-N-acetylglucosamine--N-acetylmuramyl-(pentapeptide) pyrophosphoryl-undecaprenol N-acetylglucosamine transferase n=1 Tax=Motilibacter rhizosphaerae TaxID=598652 RepID=A0A4Q7NHJ4_9ACTN|nr:undecaprenyldiphospho-muramoylpentapeptide beta-N-acetylglucosaminyltransferase [Motilibacter rhizosphaerae]RZS82916.1 UDP-N-acetylglucosamine-N-acetylmuramylpentapeptide N-acetylglucosamine transferase [Motilibacter rhizosphaerae]
MHVVLAGGGTAGHVEPALALADALRRRDPSIGITALGTPRGLEARLVPDRGYELRMIPPVPVPRRPTPQLLALPLRVRSAVAETAAVLRDVDADVVVGFGGYVAAPAYLAARRTGARVVVHEANVRPGLANRLGARMADAVGSAWPDSTLPHAEYVGMPLRRSISTLDRAAARQPARAELGLDPDAPCLLVFGGSQGARTLNRAASGAARALLDAGVQVLHAVGRGGAVDVPDDPRYAVREYLDRMDLAYAAADLVLCRSGAMTCSELAAVGLPAAYVPFPHGNGEQRLNAAPVVAAGGGLLVEDAACTPEEVERTLLPLLRDPERLGRMSAAAAAFGRRDGDDRLADLVLAAGAGRSSREDPS